METKKPLLSYVVKTQYVTNKVGLKILYQKVFTDENILTARKNAFEYYTAAIEVLESEGEITKDPKAEIIIYKNPENYEQGIGIYMRINEDVSKFGIADKINTKYLIEAHYKLSNHQERSMKIGKETEEKYFKLLKIKLELQLEEQIVFKAKRLQLMAELNRIKETSLEKIDFVDDINETQNLEQLLESTCAFLNTEGGIIILGQSQTMDVNKDFLRNHGTAFIIEAFLPLSFPNEENHFTFKKRNLLGRQFLEITITKSNRDCFYNGQFYYRCAFGNILDFDRSFL